MCVFTLPRAEGGAGKLTAALQSALGEAFGLTARRPSSAADGDAPSPLYARSRGPSDHIHARLLREMQTASPRSSRPLADFSAATSEAEGVVAPRVPVVHRPELARRV